MKFNPWIIPGVTLLATVGWLVFQENSAAALENDISVLTTRAQRIRAAMEAEENARSAASAQQEKSRDINWKDTAAKLARTRSGVPDVRSYFRVQRLILDMSPEELLAQLNEIGGLELDPATRMQVESMLVQVLSEKDFKLVLEHFEDRLNGYDSQSSIHLVMSAFSKWTLEDPAAAAAWLDQKIAEGKLVGKSLTGINDPRLIFESTIMTSLLASNPQAAGSRLGEFSEEQRLQIFQSSYPTQPEAQAALAKLARKSLPPGKATNIIAGMAPQLGQNGDLSPVDRYIADSEATSEEKQAIVRSTLTSQLHGGKMNSETFDKVYTWATTQAPERLDEIVAETLAHRMSSESDFKTASSIVLKYQESSGSDDGLVAFLKSSSTSRMEGSRALVDKIKDPVLRAEVSKLPAYQKKTNSP